MSLFVEVHGGLLSLNRFLELEVCLMLHKELTFVVLSYLLLGKDLKPDPILGVNGIERSSKVVNVLRDLFDIVIKHVSLMNRHLSLLILQIMSILYSKLEQKHDSALKALKYTLDRPRHRTQTLPHKYSSTNRHPLKKAILMEGVVDQ